MKRLILLLALCLITTSVSASWTFQNENDKLAFVAYGTAPDYITSTTAGNQYYYAGPGDGTKNKNAIPFTYAAWTQYGGSNLAGNYIRLFDGTGTQIGGDFVFPSATGSRIEIFVVGGTAYYYNNGIRYGNSTPLSQNPSFFAWFPGSPYSYPAVLDDVIIGTSDSDHIVGMPASNGYFIKKDMVNPSAAGVYNYTTGALVNSNYMYSTWGRSNATGQALVNESIYLINEDTGTIYETQYTGFATAGTTTWGIASSIIAAGAPYGRYQVKFGDFYSTNINYLADGASIAFDKDTYSQQDTAHITYVIDGAYWDTSTYTYSLKIYSGNDWSVVSTNPITISSGTVSYTFTSTNPQGEYYAVIGSTPNVGGTFIWMNYDYAALLSYVSFNGWVNDAQAATPITSANVSIVQGSIVSNTVTDTTGAYNTSSIGFLTGASMIFNVTKSGYSQYYATLTPMVAKSIPLNFTLNSTTPTASGLGIGGVARTGLLNGTLISSGYGEPISGASVTVKNTTNGEQYIKTTNMAGWYLCDEGASCFLTTKRPYDLWGSALGYSNSQNYTVVTP